MIMLDYKSAAVRWFDLVTSQQEIIGLAAQGIFHKPWPQTLEGVCRKMGQDVETRTSLYQQAVAQVKADEITNVLLHEASVSHATLEDLAWQLSQHETCRSEFDAALGDATAAMSRLFDRLPQPQTVEAPPKSGGVARQIESLINGESREILAIARGAGSADDKMRAICSVDRTKLAWNAPQWSGLLNVTDAAIRKTKFWKTDRKLAIAAAGELDADNN